MASSFLSFLEPKENDENKLNFVNSTQMLAFPEFFPVQPMICKISGDFKTWLWTDNL